MFSSFSCIRWFFLVFGGWLAGWLAGLWFAGLVVGCLAGWLAWWLAWWLSACLATVPALGGRESINPRTTLS